MDDQELQPMPTKSVVFKSRGGIQSGSSDRDRVDMIRMGKQPVLRVGLVVPLIYLQRLTHARCSVTSDLCQC